MHAAAQKIAGAEGRVEIATRAINERIRRDHLRVGKPIPSEADLAGGLGVSRTVVREALRALSALGIVELGNGRRPRVGAIDKEALGLVLDFDPVDAKVAEVLGFLEIDAALDDEVAATVVDRLAEGREELGAIEVEHAAEEVGGDFEIG